jgi:hypothetical protein
MLVTPAHKSQHKQAYAAGLPLTCLAADVTKRVLFLILVLLSAGRQLLLHLIPLLSPTTPWQAQQCKPCQQGHQQQRLLHQLAREASTPSASSSSSSRRRHPLHSSSSTRRQVQLLPHLQQLQTQAGRHLMTHHHLPLARSKQAALRLHLRSQQQCQQQTIHKLLCQLA